MEHFLTKVFVARRTCDLFLMHGSLWGFKS
jgi:hypothetical protein